jgi:hypothetical protein
VERFGVFPHGPQLSGFELIFLPRIQGIPQAALQQLPAAVQTGFRTLCMHMQMSA